MDGQVIGEASEAADWISRRVVNKFCFSLVYPRHTGIPVEGQQKVIKC